MVYPTWVLHAPGGDGRPVVVASSIDYWQARRWARDAIVGRGANCPALRAGDRLIVTDGTRVVAFTARVDLPRPPQRRLNITGG